MSTSKLVLARGRLAVLAVAALAGVACGSSSSTNVTGPSTSRCAVSLTADPAAQGAAGGTGRIAVATNRECDWSARAEVDWIQLSPTRGQGEGAVDYSVTANGQPSVRRGGVVINDQRLEIEQAAAACSLSLGSSSADVAGSGGAVDVAVQATGACAWTASSTTSWITVSPGNGTGNGSVRVTVAANTAAEARTATLTIAGQPFTVRQGAAGSAPAPTPGCTFALDPVALSVTATATVEAVRVTASEASCAWSAQPSVPWIEVQAGGSGRGNGTVQLRITENTTAAARVGAVTVGGTAIAVSQAAPGAPRTPAGTCTFSVAPTDDTAPATGRTGQVAITASEAACAWAAASPVDWITVAAASGAGSGPLGYTVAANPLQQERSATLTVAGLAVRITQAAAPPPEPECTYAVGPGSIDAPSGSSTRAVTVDTNRAACAWQASSPVAWITVAPGGGQGDGQVTLTIADNPADQARSATVTVAGQSVAVTQAATVGTCTFTVAPTAHTVPAAGGTRASGVDASRGNCDWTASSGAEWITLNRTTGRGDDEVQMSVAPNTGTQARTGTVTIAGRAVTITQDGAPAPCTFAVTPATLNLPAGGGSQPVTVDASANTCGWSTGGGAGWLSVAPASGTGDAQVTVTAQANTTQQTRTATLTVAGQPVVVTQAAAAAPACAYTLTPSTVQVAAGGGTTSTQVQTTAGCTWTASSGAAWLRITAGSPGSGSGTLTVAVDPNTGSARTGTVTVQGPSGTPQTFTVQQAAVSLVEVQLAGDIGMLGGTCPNRTFRLDGRSVETTIVTVYSGLSCADLRNGRGVEVTGLNQPNGSLLAVLVADGDDD